MKILVFKRLILTLTIFTLIAVPALSSDGGNSVQESEKLNLAIIWHQHQPMYKNSSTGKYELPWVRVHAVQEYYDSPLILNAHKEINVTYNLVPSLIEQIEDYSTITNAEKEKGGPYKYIGASDPHLTLALTPPKELTQEERKQIEEEFFWLNPYPLDDDNDDPYYSARYAELRELSGKRDLTNQEITDLTGLFFLWQISPRLHEKYDLLDLRGRRHYTRGDVIKLIEAQRKICREVLSLYKTAEKEGSEIITSPYYHPILPLLMNEGWNEVEKRSWETDTSLQLDLAVEKYKEIFDHHPAGLWPPEQAVSQNVIAPVVESGFNWLVTDETVLNKTTGETVDIYGRTLPYKIKSQQGTINVIFRDSDLSDKIGFSYGNKPTTDTVSDFIEKLKEIKNKLANPQSHLLTVALDGENWMFMAEYPNNGRSFLDKLYDRLEEAQWVNTVTPSDFLAELDHEPKTLGNLATGSWNGDLSTWRGEPEEDKAWRRLIEARKTELTRESGPDRSSSVLAGEGSDWFWWYGTDQDSGNDQTFDSLFKNHLINTYLNSGVKPEEIPRALFVKEVPPKSGTLGEVDVEVDGELTEGEDWSSSLIYKVSGDEYFDKVHVGYKPDALFIRLDTDRPARNLIGKDVSVCLYLTGENEANARTRYGKEELGFAPSQIIALHLEDVEPDGTWNVFRYESDGKGHWDFSSDIGTLDRRLAGVNEVIEFKFPLESIRVKPEENFIFRLSIEKRKSNTQISLIPDKPVRTKIPKPVSGDEIVSISDPSGDDYGPGNYTYPEDSVFDINGLFDLERYKIYDAGGKWIFTFDFGAMTNPWSAPLGFSHQLINLYLDLKPEGRTETYKEGANVGFPTDGGWDYFLKVAGWPGYGRELVTADGEKYKIDVSSDKKKNRVIASVLKDLLPSITGGHYLMVFSQDGYGKNHIRGVQKEPSTWQGGGNPAPSIGPNVYDYLAPDGEQKEILGSYDEEFEKFAGLRPYIIE